MGVVVYLLFAAPDFSSTRELRGPFSRGVAGLGHFSSFKGLILSSNFVSLYTFDSYDHAYLTSVSCLGQEA